METTIVDSGNLNYFKSFLLPDPINLLEAHKPIFALGLIDNGIACGALAGGPSGNSFQLTSLFVAPEYRGKGGASLLLQTLISCMSGQKELYEITAEFTVFNDDHILLENFLKHHNFVFEQDEETIYSVSLSSLAQNSFFSKSSVTDDIHTFSELPPACIRELDHNMRAREGAPLSVPLEKADLDRELSVAILDGAHIDSFIIFDRSFAGMLTLAYAESGKKGGSSAFSSMLRTAYQNALKKYPPSTNIIIHTVNALSVALVKKLALESKTVSKSARLRIKD